MALAVATPSWRNGDDQIEAGGAEASALFGGDGNDRILGGAGNDTLQGGEGDDTLIVPEMIFSKEA